MQFGVRLPTYAWPDLTFEQAARVKEFARKAEDLGFDALWVVEHFLVAPGLYGAVWMSPLLCLAHAASVTSRIRLATGILVLPYYHPVTLARQLQTLYYLSGGRLVLGVGPGWDEHEFASLGLRLGERGQRTDEMLAALRRLLTERHVSFAGRYYGFEDVTIEPLLPRFPELWVAGGAKIKTSLSPDKPYMAPAVLRRIASAEGWMGRGAGSQEMVKGDLAAIRAYLQAHGRDPGTLRYGHGNWVHLVDANDREEALRLQRPYFERAMGTHRSFEHLQRSYFLGTTREIVERIADLERAGFEYLVLGPLGYDLEQLERFASDIVPHFQRAC
ncbi:MAG: LLM class flavin-dependent oxidoreductase [Chloroflexi bacterium]|nr:LLM class flavin-dependent oxidoreductase [Chloroflexota bacterium]